MSSKERKTVSVTSKVNIPINLQNQIADIIRKSIHEEGQLSLPLRGNDIKPNIHELEIPISQLKQVRQSVMNTLNNRGFDININNGNFEIIWAPDEEDTNARKAVGY